VHGCVLATHRLDAADLRLASASLSLWTAGLGGAACVEGEVVALARVAEMGRDGEEGILVGTAAGSLLLCCRA
jgi:hypothetical protein